MPEKSHVGMLHHLCPVCNNTASTDILLDKRLKNSLEKDNYVLGNDLCDKCAELRKTHIPLVEANNIVHGDRLKPDETNRTGRHAFLRTEVFCDLFGGPAPTVPYVFCDTEVMDKLISMAPAPTE
jgi:hypothetical protein